MDNQNLGQIMASTLITILLSNLAYSGNPAMAQEWKWGVNLNLQADIEFDQSVIALQPVASYRRDHNVGGAPEDLKFSPDGTHVAIGGMDMSRQIDFSSFGRIELWHIESGKQIILSDAIRTYINPTFFPIAFSADSKQLAAADIGGEIKIWDLSQSSIGDPRILVFRDENPNTGIAMSLCFTPDGKRIFVGGEPTRQLDVMTGQKVGFSDQHTFKRSDVIDFSPDGKQVAFGGLDSGIKVLDLDSDTTSDAFERTFKKIFFHKFLPSGSFHLTAGTGAVSVAWDSPGTMVAITERSSRNHTATIAMNGESVVDVSADGRLLAIVNARIKETEAYRQWLEASAHKRVVYPNTMSLWKIHDGKPEFLAQFAVGSDEIVRAMAISPDGNTLVTSGAHLRFWDISEIQKKIALP